MTEGVLVLLYNFGDSAPCCEGLGEGSDHLFRAFYATLSEGLSTCYWYVIK